MIKLNQIRKKYLLNSSLRDQFYIIQWKHIDWLVSDAIYLKNHINQAVIMAFGSINQKIYHIDPKFYYD